MVTKIQDGLVTYIGFHANKNKKFRLRQKFIYCWRYKFEWFEFKIQSKN